jgi:hypothetical protein
MILTHLPILLQQDVNVYRSMPPMPDITRLLQSSAYQKPDFHPSYDPICTDDDQDSDDGRTLAEVKKARVRRLPRRAEALLVMILCLAIRGDQGPLLESARRAPHQLATSERPSECLSLHSDYFPCFRLGIF